MTWNVYRYDINSQKIYQYNVFNHNRFLEEVKAIKTKDKDEFSEKLRIIAMYYFWSKAEHEIVITSFPPYINKDEVSRIIRIASENDVYRYNRYTMHVNLDRGEKIDIYNQLQMNWEHFVDYVWNSKGKRRNTK